jgi:Icc-related predicted phosphoesterase
VRRLKTEGVNIVSLEGADELPYKTVLFTFDEADIAENTSWIVKGAKTTLSSVVIDADAGCATLVTRRGFVLSVR